MERTKKYYENIDILRGFAILLVVLGHALAIENIGASDVEWCNVIYDFIYSFHMPLFFLISGFCYSHCENYGRFVLHKSKFLLLPYLVFNLITMVMQRVLPFFTLVESDLTKEIRQTCFYGGSIWFVYVLFEIMLIFPLYERIISGKVERALLLLVISMGIYMLWGKNTGFLCMAQMTNYIPYFIIGHILRILNEKEVFLFKTLERNTVRIFLVVITFLVDIGILFLEDYFVNNSIILYLLKVMAALMGSAFSYMLIRFISVTKIRQILKQFGQYSLQIYLFNGYFISVSRTILISVLGISNVFLIVAANFISGMVCNYIWCYYILKINFVKILCGKR